jgi:hypothetical protein
VTAAARPGALAAVLVTAVLPATSVLGGVHTAFAQEPSGWAVTAQSVEVDVGVDAGTGEGSAEVHVRMTLAPTPSDGSLPLSLLGFGDADVGEVRTEDGRLVVLWPASGGRRAASLEPLPAEGDGTTEVSFRYRVDGAVEMNGGSARVRIPIVTGPAAPEGDGFSATVRLPEEWRFREGFPTGLRSSGGGVYEVSLPVVPSMLAVRARTDGSWRPGFPLAVDTLTVTLLLAFAGFGWRHLRGVVAGRRSAGPSAA